MEDFVVFRYHFCRYKIEADYVLKLCEYNLGVSWDFDIH